MAHKKKKKQSKNTTQYLLYTTIYANKTRSTQKQPKAKTTEHRFHAEIVTEITTWNSERKDA